MRWNSQEILSILDQCSRNFTFPMLDNGYVYLAATRLSLYRTETEWGMVIEVFGYSPRAGLPDTNIYSFASTLYNRDLPESYKTRKAYDNYLANHPHDESRFIYPIGEKNWLDHENCERVAEGAIEVVVRGRALKLPPLEEYGRLGIQLAQPPQVQVFELCRLLAGSEREQLLSTPEERRISLPPDLQQVFQLEEWNHPNVVAEDLPSQSETFQQLAHVAVTGDIGFYQPSHQPNTHWKNWPEGGSL